MIKPNILICSQNNDKRLNYLRALRAAGGDGDAIYCPPLDLSYDGLLLSGGADADPAFYGQQTAGAFGIDLPRDRTEIALTRAYIAAGKPVFGICRGLQLLNIVLGGTIIQHLTTAETHRNADGDLRHEINAIEGGLPARLYGPHFIANSMHHQAIDRVADGLRITAFAPDGVPEAAEHTSLPVFGVQWHPERLCCAFPPDGAADGLLLFRHFITLCGGLSK